MGDNTLLLLRLSQYADSRGIQLVGKDLLGYGSDGTVGQSSRRTAVKALYHRKNYDHELECYRRLKAEGIRTIGIFDVPFLKTLKCTN